MPKSSDRMGDLYERWSADDGFLHVRHMGSSLVLLMGGPCLHQKASCLLSLLSGRAPLLWSRSSFLSSFVVFLGLVKSAL